MHRTGDRAGQARAEGIGQRGGDVNVDLALNQALTELQRIHKRLMQDTYFAGDALRLL